MKKPLAALAAFTALTMGGCSWFKSEATVAKDAAIDCAKQDLGATVPEAGMSILMTVAGIIFEGGANWQDTLTQLGNKYGPEAVACAAHIAEQMFRPAPDATPSTGDHVETPHDRALEVLAGKSFK